MSGKNILIFLGVFLFVVAAGLIWLRYFAGAFSAREQPSALERLLTRQARKLAVPRDAKALKNPLTTSDAVLAEARAHWADHCALCHANDGSGSTEIGKNLYPKAPDLRQRDTQELADGELYYAIQNGIRLTGMPAWGSPQDGKNNQDSWKLVLFIRHLPQLTPEEEKEMEEFNPQGRMELEEEKEEEQFLNEEQPSNRTRKSSSNHNR